MSEELAVLSRFRDAAAAPEVDEPTPALAAVAAVDTPADATAVAAPVDGRVVVLLGISAVTFRLGII